jgi:hypothetical protein
VSQKRDFGSAVLEALVMALFGFALIAGAFVLIWKSIWRMRETR